MLRGVSLLQPQAIICATPPFALLNVNDQWKHVLGDHKPTGQVDSTPSVRFPAVLDLSYSALCVAVARSTNPTCHHFFCCASIVQEGDASLLQSLQVYAFQRDLIYKLAADCARGVPGSAIFLSHASAPAPQESDCDESVPPPPSPTGPTVFYVKVPLLFVV
jgi:hypothetical protein